MFPFHFSVSGFNEDKTALWKELAQSNCNQLNDPYIRAIFAFLTESDTNYETILVIGVYNNSIHCYSVSNFVNYGLLEREGDFISGQVRFCLSGNYYNNYLTF